MKQDLIYIYIILLIFIIFMSVLKKILLIDDDYKLRKILYKYLQAQNFIVHESGNIKFALALVNKNKPDLIIVDIMMHHLDGYDFVKLLKLDKYYYYIPVIFLTAKGMTYDRILGYNLGCHAYVTKPFNPQELLAIIRNIFKNIDVLQSQLYSCKLLQIHTLSIEESDIHFTSKEKKILSLVVKGYMNKEIALDLNLSLRNTEKYISKLLKKTNTRNRTQLVNFVMKL